MSRNKRNPNNRLTKIKKSNRKAESAKIGASREPSTRPREDASAPRRRGAKLPRPKPAGDKAKSHKPDLSTATTSDPPNPNTPNPEIPVPDAEPEQAAARLRKSLQSKVSTQYDDIAQALINTAVKGNMTGARLIVELTGADKASADESDRDIMLLNIPDPELLAAEPEWKDPEVGDVWVGDHWESPSKPADPNG